MKKKALSVLLALVMLLALVPAAVFAAQSAPEAEEEQVMIPFAKEWDVEEDTQLPESITVSLCKGGDVLETKTVTAEDGWTTEFAVAKSAIFNEDGSVADFTVKEEAVEGFEETANVAPVITYTAFSVDGSAWSEHDPCNALSIDSRNGSGTVVVAKKGSDYTVWTLDELNADECHMIYESAKANINAFSGAKESNFDFFSGLDNTASGMTVTENEITFAAESKWSIVSVGAYVPESIEVAAAAITNTAIPVPPVVPETVSVNVTKVWEGDTEETRPAAITVQLLANNEACGEAVELNAQGGWAYAWNDLAKYDEDGAVIVYLVQEVEVPEGYTATYGQDDNGGLVITNTLNVVPEPDPEPTPEPDPEPTPDPKPDPASQPDPEPDPQPAPAPVQTGDSFSMSLYVVLGVLAVAAAAAMVIVPMKKSGKHQG